MSSTIGSVRRVICDFVAPSRIVSDSGQQVVALDCPSKSCEATTTDPTQTK